MSDRNSRLKKIARLAKTGSLAEKAAALTAKSQPMLYQSNLKHSNISPGVFASMPGAAPGLQAQAIQMKKTEGPNVPTPGHENIMESILSAGDGGPTLERQFPRIAKFDLSGLALQQKSSKQIGTLLGVNENLLKGNTSAAEFIQAKNGKVPQGAVEPDSTALIKSNISRSALLDRLVKRLEEDPELEELLRAELDNLQSDLSVQDKELIKQALATRRLPNLPVTTSSLQKLLTGTNQPRIQPPKVADVVEDLSDFSDDEDDAKPSKPAPAGSSSSVDDPLKKQLARDKETLMIEDNFKTFLNSNKKTLLAILDDIGKPEPQSASKPYLQKTLLALYAKNPGLIAEVIATKLYQQRKAAEATKGMGLRVRQPSKRVRLPGMDVDYAANRLEVLIGERGAGNDSKLLRNQIASLAQYLYLNQAIDKEMLKSIINKTVL